LAALLDQVLGGFVPGLYVVDDNSRNFFVLKYPVVKQDRDIFFYERFQMVYVLRVIGQRNQKAIYPAVEQGFGVGNLLVHRFQRLANDQVIASFVGYLL